MLARHVPNPLPTRRSKPWTERLESLAKGLLEGLGLAAVGATVPDTCVLNLYLDESQGIPWHKDDEVDMWGSALCPR